MASKISQVHHDRSGGPITRVRISKDNGPIIDALKQQVIDAIQAGEIVHTAPPHGPGARVRVEGNPPYLKSDPDGTEENNLGGLPEY